MKRKQFQTVIVTLSDGRIGVFSGRGFVTEKDRKRGVSVISVEFSLPRPLPEGYTFGPVPLKKEVGR